MRTARFLSAVVLVVTVLIVAPAATTAGAAEISPVGPSGASIALSSKALPPIQIATARSGIAPGLLFANPQPHAKNHSWTGGPTIYDNAGHVIWYKPSTSIHVTEPVTFRGKSALAYHQTTHSFGPWTAGYWV